MTPPQAPPRLVAYGHSWVGGAGASAPEQCLVQIAARLLGVTAVNLGVGGSSSAGTANLVTQQSVPAASVYLVMTGLNDARLAGTDPDALEAYRHAITVIVTGCLAASPQATALVVEQPALEDYSRHAPHDRGSTQALELYNQVLRSELAGERGAVLVPVVGWDPATMLAADTVHPNDLGHATVGRAVAAAYRAASSIGSTSPVHD